MSSGTVTVILIKGDHNNLVDDVIMDVSRGEYSHSAIKILGSTLEALGQKDQGDLYPGVWLHAPDKYDNNPAAVFIQVELPDLAAAEAEARRLIGTLYGYTDCVRGGLHKLIGVDPVGNAITANCSETVTRILRAGGFDILPEVTPDCVTPVDLGNVLI